MKSIEQLLKLQNIDLALERLPTQQQALEQERASLLAKIDVALLTLYNKLRRMGLGKALARVDEGACTCCLAVIAPSELQQIQTSEKVQTCSNCGRILYLGTLGRDGLEGCN